MKDSILQNVKKMLGITPEYTQFDLDILLHINSVFSILRQLGVGPEEGFVCENASDTWDDFIGDDPRLSMVKSYMFLKVRLMFDPPQVGSVMDSYNKQIAELEWRLNAVADYPNA